MAKLEELSELLVSEIRDFEEAVKKLEVIQKEKITINFAELKKVLLDHEVGMKKQISSLQQSFQQVESKIKSAKIYPQWAVVVFILSLILNCIGGVIFLF